LRVPLIDGDMPQALMVAMLKAIVLRAVARFRR
jgi:hypothetical protein